MKIECVRMRIGVSCRLRSSTLDQVLRQAENSEVAFTPTRSMWLCGSNESTRPLDGETEKSQLPETATRFALISYMKVRIRSLSCRDTSKPEFLSPRANEILESSQLAEIESQFNAILDKYGAFLRQIIARICLKDLGIHFDDTEMNRAFGSGGPSKLRGKSIFMGLISTGSRYQ